MARLSVMKRDEGLVASRRSRRKGQLQAVVTPAHHTLASSVAHNGCTHRNEPIEPHSHLQGKSPGHLLVVISRKPPLRGDGSHIRLRCDSSECSCSCGVAKAKSQHRSISLVLDLLIGHSRQGSCLNRYLPLLVQSAWAYHPKSPRDGEHRRDAGRGEEV